jgi:hypothetical protein
MAVLFVLGVLASVVWVGVDAAAIKRATGRQVAGSSAFAWVVGCAVIWIIVFPYYLYKRGEQKQAEPSQSERRAPADFGGFCGGCGAQLLRAAQFCPACGRPRRAVA